MHDRSRMAINPRISTMPGRSTSGGGGGGNVPYGGDVTYEYYGFTYNSVFFRGHQQSTSDKPVLQASPVRVHYSRAHEPQVSKNSTHNQNTDIKKHRCGNQGRRYLS